jgi:hypothetical protein
MWTEGKSCELQMTGRESRKITTEVLTDRLGAPPEHWTFFGQCFDAGEQTPLECAILQRPSRYFFALVPADGGPGCRYISFEAVPIFKMAQPIPVSAAYDWHRIPGDAERRIRSTGAMASREGAKVIVQKSPSGNARNPLNLRNPTSLSQTSPEGKGSGPSGSTRGMPAYVRVIQDSMYRSSKRIEVHEFRDLYVC